jgi:hypothetical protein
MRPQPFAVSMVPSIPNSLKFTTKDFSAFFSIYFELLTLCSFGLPRSRLECWKTELLRDGSARDSSVDILDVFSDLDLSER